MWNSFYKSFTDLRFIYHKVKYLSVWSKTFSKFTKLCSSHYKPVLPVILTWYLRLVPIILIPGLSSTQPLIYRLSPWVCVFWTFHIYAIVECLLLCLWLLSPTAMFLGFIHVVVHISALFLLIIEYYPTGWIFHILFVYLKREGQLGCLHNTWRSISSYNILYLLLCDTLWLWTGKEVYLIHFSMSIAYTCIWWIIDVQWVGVAIVYSFHDPFC